mgnify:CR=1 FL=1|tara:strand:+ start:12833 stop:14152 length:1320 start_codon:yes stop_codon:yes gene_type:complete
MPTKPKLRRHTPAISGGFDATEWAGQELFTYSGGPITLPATAGRFDDLLDFLHGYGSATGQDLTSQTTAQVQFSDMTVRIDGSDFVYLESAAHTLEAREHPHGSVDGVRILHPGSGGILDPLGFSNGQTSAVVNGKNRMTAANPFPRGLFKFSVYGCPVLLDGAQGASNDKRLGQSVNATIQSLPIALTVRSKTNTLEDALPAGSRCHVRPDGRVVIQIKGSNPIPSPTEWTAKGRRLWARLGGDGSETPETAHNQGAESIQEIKTARPAFGFLAFDRSYTKLRRFTRGRSDHALLSDGSVVSSHLPPLQGWEFVGRVPGPAMGYAANLEEQARRFWLYAQDTITLFPQWGDMDSPEAGSIETRKHVDVYSAIGVTPYTETQTIEADIEASHYHKRKGGRLCLRRAPDDDQRRVEDYGRLEIDVFQEIEMVLLDDPRRS